MAYDYERHLEARELRRFRAEERAVKKIDRQLARADQLIGELVRDGKTIYYAMRANGRIREETNRLALVDFLIRNGDI